MAGRARKPSEQLKTWTCDVCGQTVDVARVAGSRYLFTAPCRCDALLAWATKGPAPMFDDAGQGTLFP